MWKMLIADDEPKIRRGLARLIKILALEIDVIGEAEDGELALEMVKAYFPQLLLVDICMPFLNGLELIEAIQKINPNCLVIVITGYDEFTYAQQAIKLGVFDYLLKPIAKEQLQSVLIKAIQQLEQQTSREKYTEWSNEQLKKNLPFLRERFLDEWLHGMVSEPDIKEQMNFLQITLNEDSQGILAIKLVEKLNHQTLDGEWDRQLMLFAIQNVVADLLVAWEHSIVFKDRKDYVIAVIPHPLWSEWVDLPKLITGMIDDGLKIKVLVEAMESNGGLTGICSTYDELLKRMENESNHSPLAALAKRYIDTHFHKVDLSLQEVADAIGISPSYLSRLLRQDIGASFIDYLSQHRIQHALKLLNDPTIKIYEVAEKVGYKGQHYFSTFLKKFLAFPLWNIKKGAKDNDGEADLVESDDGGMFTQFYPSSCCLQQLSKKDRIRRNKIFNWYVTG